nr:SURF1 family protein [Lysobacter sp. CAU 1642]
MACLFGALGAWQYGRGVAKTAFLEAWDSALEAPPETLLPWRRAEVVERPQPVTGRIDALDGGRWLLLDNARRGSEVGLRAYFIASVGDDRGLLVDAGWLPFDRARGLPDMPPLPRQEPADGLLVPWPGQGIALGESGFAAAGQPTLLLRLERERLAADAGVDLVDGLLRLAPRDGAAFARDLDALPNTLPAEKHFGYALQWWGLAFATLVVATVLTLRRRPR